MLLPTHELGKLIVDAASQYIMRDTVCTETYINGKWVNTSDCINALKCSFNNKPIDCDDPALSNEAYCSIFAWSMNYQGFIAGNYETTTLNLCKTAGALDLLNRAKMNGVPVDYSPSPGCTFYRRSNAKGATGHVGIVVGMIDGYLHTIEGNASFIFNGNKFEGIWGKHYTQKQVKDYGFQFIHFEQLFSNEDNPIVEMEVNVASAESIAENPSDNTFPAYATAILTNGFTWAGALAIGTVIWFFWDKLKK